MFQKVNNGLLYVNGEKLLGICEEVTSPVVKNKMVTQKPLGHGSEVDLPGGLEKLESKFKLTSPDPKILMSIANPAKAVQFMLRGSLEYWGADGRTDEKAIVAIYRGYCKEVPLGAFKQNENVAIDISISVNSVKWTVAGSVVYDLDTVNNKYLCAGDDFWAGLKANIGF